MLALEALVGDGDFLQRVRVADRNLEAPVAGKLGNGCERGGVGVDDDLAPAGRYARRRFGGRKRRNECAARLESSPGASPCFSAYEIKDEIDSGNFLFERGISVVNDTARSEGFHESSVFSPAGGGNECAVCGGELNGEMANTSARSVNQHALPG